MMNLKIQNLISKFKKLFPQEINIEKNRIDIISEGLNVKIPEDLKYFSMYFDGNNGPIINGMLAYDENDSPDNIISWTKSFRNLAPSLPHRFLVLATGGEGLIFLDTESGSVLWIGESDYYNLCEDKPLLDNPTIFPTFTAFFEFLLNEEEKLRGITAS